jgi:hypothetical protein
MNDFGDQRRTATAAGASTAAFGNIGASTGAVLDAGSDFAVSHAVAVANDHGG